MKHFIKSVIILSLVFCFSSFKQQDEQAKKDKRIKVKMITTHGTMLLALYNETPKHRDNFVKLVNEKKYDSLLFHRVINEFMIQGGDIDSKNAKKGEALGAGDLPYQVDAEFVPTLFHKKGALAAARDGNAARVSSSMQFYIVQGKVKNDSTLIVDEKRINGWLAENYTLNMPENNEIKIALDKAMEDEDYGNYQKLYKQIKDKAKTYTFDKYVIPQAHREVYKTIGGTPFLDQNYTVFGELLKGFEVLDKIAGVETNDMNRPHEDVRILSMRIVK
ncbi:peptidylprolyl isomerase [Pontimicrobium sp. IMCC45349]|uniref:peptidylprolyl isomerase n=1 Tax=Pontimicrobium sp. IMCC45349 TaxID=3391574 RepID=UPI0039A044DC